MKTKSVLVCKLRHWLTRHVILDASSSWYYCKNCTDVWYTYKDNRYDRFMIYLKADIGDER